MNLSCPKCKSTHTTKHGFNVTVTKGKQPRYKCQECGVTFFQAVIDKKKEEQS